MAFRIVIDKIAAPKFEQNLAGLYDRFEEALTAAVNMAASMIKTQGDADISGAGKFGQRWTSGFKVEAETSTLGRMRIVLSHDVPYAGVFEKGGVITGNPLLWIPISGSDAEGIQASNYGGLFSVNRKSGGAPLLFSIADKKPKYFGVESVTIPKLFHLDAISKSVMSNFRQLFDNAFRG